MMRSGRFFIDNRQICDSMGFIEPIQINSTYHGVQVKNLLNKNWEQFNEQKCLIQRLSNQNKKLLKINKELNRRIGEVKHG